MYMFVSVDPKELEDIVTSLQNEDTNMLCYQASSIRSFYNYFNKEAVLEEIRADAADGVIDSKYKKYFSELDGYTGYFSVDYIKNIFKAKGVENVDRLYYRMGVIYRSVGTTDILDTSKRYYNSSNSYIAYESVIKFVDL